MTDDTNRRMIKSLLRSQEIIEHLRHTDGATLSDIATAVDLSPGSVHTYLATLQSIGYVVKSDREYRLGPEFVTLGEYVRNHSRLYQAAKSEVDKLAERTEEVVHLIVEHRGRGIALYERLGEEAVGSEYHRNLRQRAHQHLHCTASGKAILAHLPEERLIEVLDEHGLAARTPNTITSRERLFDELARIREQGHALNDEEEVVGIVAVGAPVMDRNDEVLGSIAISAPKTRMEQEPYRSDVIEMIQRAANVCEVNLQTEDLL